MSEPFIAEIRIWANTFAPRGWAFCNGQILQIAQHTALFSLVATTYGGDGRSTFGVPNLQGRLALHQGNGPGLTPRWLGQVGGAATATLTAAQLASHNHLAQGVNDDASSNDPTNRYYATADDDAYAGGGTSVTMAANVGGMTGGGGAHNNMQPYLAINYCIALQGLYPSRS